jgi:superfamily II DNA/RNA helicase
MYQRFHLPFEILTNDKLEASHTGNWFLETDLVIARLDKLSRDESVQEKLKAPDCRWDLIICDEAHKMSATFFGGEISYTKRFQLGRLLSTVTRHFLLLTATPHNGKDEDFQIFLSLLDADRFEGHHRNGNQPIDARDLMRRMVKEQLLTFEGKPLFPERQAYTVPYKLSDSEASLYTAVTAYVREEFNRADALNSNKRAGTVGFALTILQRRLASSPEAIYQSLKRRRKRLLDKLNEFIKKGSAEMIPVDTGPFLNADDIVDIDDAPDNEVEKVETEILDEATAARSIEELRAEIATLKHLEEMAAILLRSGTDTKWRECAKLLDEIFKNVPAEDVGTGPLDSAPTGASHPRPKSSPRQKLVIFTEHRDTLNYLYKRICTRFGREDAVVVIHGGMKRKDRIRAQEAFKFQPEVQVLLATDAAGEGINLQRAHLMINYDLPWNPNRIEQRFGRIHRIGQTEVCFLWNLVAAETREGDVYRRLLEKLSEAREALGGQVFDVLGKLIFDGKSLRELLIEAIRYGDSPEVRSMLDRVVDTTLDRKKLEELLEERNLVHDVMDASRIRRIREDMERAEARRLQPHYIESFFIQAFTRLGGTISKREPRRYEITYVPANIRNRNKMTGSREPVLSHYERVTFEKELIAPQGQSLASFLCPGSPLLTAVIDLSLERNRDILKRGTILVDEKDSGTSPRIFFYLEHAIQDATITRSGSQRVVSKRVIYIELDAKGNTRHIHYAPYLDFRPLESTEPQAETILSRPEYAWITKDIEKQAQTYMVTTIVPEHLEEVKKERIELIEKTKAAVQERLKKEINYWDYKAEQLKLEEKAGKVNARLNSGEARKRADELHGRLQKRLEELKLEAQISPLPPVIQGGFVVVPIGLIHAMQGKDTSLSEYGSDTQQSSAKARAIVMEIERKLGYEPIDREVEKLGYDIESRIPGTGKLRFIEVKGRISGAKSITVTKNEILYSLNKPDDFILAIVEFLDGDAHRVHYIRRPFDREPDFLVTSVNYDFEGLLARAEEPR